MNYQSDVAIVATSPVIRCILRGPEGILFFREPLFFDHNGNVHVGEASSQYSVSSHWELPKGMILLGESLVEAAARVAYDRTMLSASVLQPVRRDPVRHHGVILRAEHFYVDMVDLAGDFTIKRFDSNKKLQGTWCWIKPEFLTEYSTRKETISTIRSVL